MAGYVTATMSIMYIQPFRFAKIGLTQKDMAKRNNMTQRKSNLITLDDPQRIANLTKRSNANQTIWYICMARQTQQSETGEAYQAL